MTALALVLLLLPALSSCAGVDVSPACVGYASGKAGETAYAHRENDPYILPSEIVKAFAVFAANPEKETAARVLYDDDPVWLKGMLHNAGVSREELISAMNEKAQREGLDLSFGSLTGMKDREEDLCRLLGETDPGFIESRGTLAALKKTAELFYGDETLSALLCLSSYAFQDGSVKSRSAPLISDKSQFGLKQAVLYIGGTAVYNGQTAYAAIAAVKEEETSFSAVGENSGNDSPVFYAATDAGNLCGLALGVNYDLAYSASKDPDKAGMTVGASIFGGFVIVFAIVCGVMLLVAAILGIVTVSRRNRAGRRKYAPKDEESPPSEKENGQ